MTKKNRRQAKGFILPSSKNKDSSVFWKSKCLSSLQLLVTHFKIYFKIIHLLAISLSSYKESSTKLVRISFSDNPITLQLVQALTRSIFPSCCFTIIVHISQIEVCKFVCEAGGKTKSKSCIPPNHRENKLIK